MKDDFKTLCSDTEPVTSLLFGQELGTTVKNLADTSKVTSQVTGVIKRPKFATMHDGSNNAQKWMLQEKVSCFRPAGPRGPKGPSGITTTAPSIARDTGRHIRKGARTNRGTGGPRRRTTVPRAMSISNS